ncbi:MAG: B12-binding domain-containing radical SAM protein, partial [Candidatus Hermodarchaeota archaeon]
ESPLLVGGYWASTVGDHFDEFSIFDYIIEGYSADQIANAVNNLEWNKKDRRISALAQIDWNQYNLNTHFLVDPSKYFHRPSRFLSGYLTSIGCPNACGFCYNTVLQNKKTCYSERSVEKVKEDLEILDQKYNFRTIQFKDLNFFYNSKRAFDILDFLKYKGKRIQYAVDITVKDASEEIFQRVPHYGIKELWIGLESFNENSLRKMNKEYSKEKLEQVFVWAEKYRIMVFGNIMLGAPWQDRKYIEKTISMALEYIYRFRYVMITFNSLRPIIGTPIQEEYFPDIYEKLNFNEMIDAFSFYLGEKQQRIYGRCFDFIDFEKVHNAFWFIKELKTMENHPDILGRRILVFIRKRIERQLQPPYFSAKYLDKCFLIRHSTRQMIMNILPRLFMLIQIHMYWRYFKKVIGGSRQRILAK